MKRNSNPAPSTHEETEALLNVLQGEFKELALLVLLTRWPARVVVRWQQRDVVPLIEQLAQEFQSFGPAEPDALLFPKLATLPPHLFGEAEDVKGAKPPSFHASPHQWFTQTLAALEATVLPPKGQPAPASSSRARKPAPTPMKRRARREPASPATTTKRPPPR